MDGLLSFMIDIETAEEYAENCPVVAAGDDLFADDSEDDAPKPTKKKDGLFDEDDFDDFIEDDLGIQQALKREHEASLKGARDGPATDVSQMQLMDMVRIRVL